MPTAESFESMMDKHKVDHLMKLFMKNVGPVPNWDPEIIQRKFLYTNRSKIWLAKQESIKVTKNFMNVPNFKRELKGGYNFIALVSTSNLDADSEENRVRLNDFFLEYNDPFIWVICRGKFKPRRTMPSEEHIEVVDLNFGPQKDRNNPLVLNVPIHDIFMTVLIEQTDKVSILAHDSYFSLTRKGGKLLLKIKSAHTKFFKPITPENVPRYQESTMIDPPSVAESSQADSRFETTSQRSFNSTSSGLSTQPPDCTIEFYEDYFVVKTPTRNQRFDAQSKKDHLDLVQSSWEKDTPAARAEQWDELKKLKFNLFERVQDSDADGLVFIPAQQLLTKFHTLVAYWKKLSGEKSAPKNMFYVIYDKKADRPMTSEYNYPNNIFELYLFVAFALCAIDYMASNPKFVPDCKTFRVLKRPNFVRSGTKFTKEKFYEHLDTHRSSMIFNHGKLSHFDFWHGNLFLFLDTEVSKKTKEQLFDQAVFVTAKVVLPQNFFSHPQVQELILALADFRYDHSHEALQSVLDKIGNRWFLTSRSEDIVAKLRRVSILSNIMDP